jgi:hypothetical protein
VSEILRARVISLPDAEAVGAAAPLKANGGTYGTFDHGHGAPGLRGGFMSNPPPKGGWVTYVKSFKVGVVLIQANWRFSFLIYGRVRIGIYRVSWCFVSVCCCFSDLPDSSAFDGWTGCQCIDSEAIGYCHG